MLYEMLTNWRVWVGGAAGLMGFYAFVWAMAIGCVLMGGSPQVCGL